MRKTLTDMLSTAEANPGTPVRRKLSNGLQVDILVTAEGEHKIQISRAGRIWPGKTEWDTLRRALPPGFILSPTYRRAQARGRNYLCARLQRIQQELV